MPNCYSMCEYFAEGTCEVNCQATCQKSCQNCEGRCETYCESRCQVGCQVSCQEECEHLCQSKCELACQAACQLGCQDCQTNCQIHCMTACEEMCQNCLGRCESTCEKGCQDHCESNCTSYCESNCTSYCESNCTSYCESICTSYCESNCTSYCESHCQVGCQVGCQNCEGRCEDTCEKACQNCEGRCETTCENACQGCQSTCESNCQVSLATGEVSFNGYREMISQSGRYTILSVNSGGTVTMSVVARNTGSIAGDFKLRVNGGVPDSSLVTIPGGEQGTIQVNLPLGNLASKDYCMYLQCMDDDRVDAGEVYTVTLRKYEPPVQRAFTLGSHSMTNYDQLIAQSGSSYDVGLKEKGTAIFHVNVRNTGNVTSNYKLQVSGDLSYSTSATSIAAGQEKPVSISLPLGSSQEKHYSPKVVCSEDGTSSGGSFSVTLRKYVETPQTFGCTINNYSITGQEEILIEDGNQYRMLVHVGQKVTAYVEVFNSGNRASNFRLQTTDGRWSSSTVNIPSMEQRIIVMEMVLPADGETAYVFEAICTDQPSVKSTKKITVVLTNQSGSGQKPLRIADYSFDGDAVFDTYEMVNGVRVINLFKNEDQTIRGLFDVVNPRAEMVKVKLVFEGSYTAISPEMTIPANSTVTIPLNLVLLGDDNIDIKLQETTTGTTTAALMRIKAKVNPNPKRRGFTMIEFKA